MMNSYKDLAAYNKANLGAMMSASTIVSSGVQTFQQTVADFYKSAAEQALSTARKMIEARDLRDVVTLQNDYARQITDSFMAESAKLSELSLKVANEALAPLNAQVNAAVC